MNGTSTIADASIRTVVRWTASRTVTHENHALVERHHRDPDQVKQIYAGGAVSIENRRCYGQVNHVSQLDRGCITLVFTA